MNAQVVQPTGLIQYILPIVVVAFIFAFRIRRMSQEQPLRLERLWVVPAIYLVLVVIAFVATPPGSTGGAVCLVALVIGAALGWQRGKAMRITVNPVTHQLNQKASPAAMLFLLALVGVKLGLRAEGSRFHFDAVLLTDALLAFALGMFSATRAEMFLRGKRMLVQLTGSPVA